MSDSEDEISTQPGLVPTTAPGAGSLVQQPGQSSLASYSRGRLALKLAHVGGVLGFLAWLTPWALRRWEAGDRLPLAGIAAGLLMVVTRANLPDAAKAVSTLLPWGKGGK